MFKLIHQLLQVGNLYGESNEIDIAKGVNNTPSTIKEAWRQGVREIKALKYTKNGN